MANSRLTKIPLRNIRVKKHLKIKIRLTLCVNYCCYTKIITRKLPQTPKIFGLCPRSSPPLSLCDVFCCIIYPDLGPHILYWLSRHYHFERIFCVLHACELPFLRQNKTCVRYFQMWWSVIKYLYFSRFLSQSGHYFPNTRGYKI